MRGTSSIWLPEKAPLPALRSPAADTRRPGLSGHGREEEDIGMKMPGKAGDNRENGSVFI